MSEKITMSALTAMLSVRSGDSKEQVETFLKELFGIISSELESGESVKVPGIGIFKTIDVEARKSVNVNTGEETLIPGHKKIVFLPGKDLAATVNAPFEMFQTMELTDDIAAQFETQPEQSEQPEEPEQYDVTVQTEEQVEQVDPVEDTCLYQHSDLPELEDQAELTGYSENSECSERSEYSEIPETRENPEELENPENPENSEHSENSDHPEPPASAQYSPIISATPAVRSSRSDRADKSDWSDRPDWSEKSDNSVISDSAACRPVRRRFWPGFFTGFGAAVVCGLVAWSIVVLIQLKRPTEDTEIAAIQPVPVETHTVPVDSLKPKATDTAQAANAEATTDKAEASESKNSASDNDKPAVPTQPSDRVKYDTITKTRYLTTMAKDHYGNYHLWPYIYKENSKMLGHPDRIKPGTKVVIPDLAKYGVDPKNPNDIAKAKKLGNEIYARYR